MVQFRSLNTLIGSFFLGFSLLSVSSARAEIMFEGYYKVASSNTKIGYFIQRYEFDPKAKKFISTYYIETNTLGGNSSESLRAFADDKFQPISYQYTVKTPELTKMIDATFKGTVMTAVITQGNSSQTVSKKVPKGTFLSTFLGYLMLQKGYSNGKKFNYSAVAEEDAESYNGEAYIKDQQKFLEKPVFKILNNFKGVAFVSFVTEKGEVLGTQSPVQQIATELAPSPNLATEGFTLPVKTLNILFGRVPVGKVNTLAQSPTASAEAGKSSATPSGTPGAVTNPPTTAEPTKGPEVKPPETVPPPSLPEKSSK